MEFGVFYQLPCAPVQSPEQRYASTIAQAQLADDLGFTTVWLAELHFDPGFSIMPAPLLVAAAIAQSTRKIRIGTAVNLLPLHHPIRLAEEISTLDLLSHGRVVLGIGRGSIPSHFEGFGVSLSEATPRFWEALEIIYKAWTTDEFSYQGKYYQVVEARVVPKPSQKPHPPIYVAANSPETFYQVGAMGYNLLVAPLIGGSIQRAQAGLRVYRHKLGESGHDSGNHKVTVTLPVYVAEDGKQARAEAKPSFENYVASLRNLFSSPAAQRAISLNPKLGQAQKRTECLTYQQIYDEFAVIGDPDECVSKLKYFREVFAPSEFMCWFNLGGLLPPEKVEKSMRLFSESVVPNFE